MPERIAVLLDFENVHRTGFALHEPFGRETHQAVPDPVKLADMIATRRSRPSEATCIAIFRGRPDPRKQPVPTSTFDRQATYWERDHRTRVVSRALNYRDWPAEKPIEKGVDVSLAVELVRLALVERAKYDALVVFSSDTDLQPAITLCAGQRLPLIPGGLRGPAIEAACWDGSSVLKVLPGASHRLSDADWRAVVYDWTSRR